MDVLLRDEIIEDALYDNQLDIGAEDDQIKDPEDDQDFDEELNNENEHQNEAEESYSLEDEEKETSDSAFDENDTSTIDEGILKHPSMSLEVNILFSVYNNVQIDV